MSVFVQNEDEVKELLNNKIYDLIVIGAGPAGSSAAMYAARSELNVLVIDKAPGAGSMAIAHKIANYPSQTSEEMTGEALLKKMREHAKNFGAKFVQTHVQGVTDSDGQKTIFTTGGIIQSKAVFIATGSRGGRSNKIKGEDNFTGRGVSYCATCDGAFCKDSDVVVIGDNEEALEEALILDKFASSIKILVPGKKIVGSISPDIINNRKKISITYGVKVIEISGQDKVEFVLTDKDEKIKCDGVFVYLSGNKPDTSYLYGAVELDESGNIKVNEFMETNQKGIFAGGDIRKPPVKQVVVAAADGAIAAISIEKYINNKTDLKPQYG